MGRLITLICLCRPRIEQKKWIPCEKRIQIRRMKSNEYTIPSGERAGFPEDICLTSPKYSKMRRSVERRYGSYSETIVWRNTIKWFPEEFGISNYDRKTWNTKQMRDRISDIVEEKESLALISDECAVIPGHVCSHFHMRIGSYLAKKARFRLHNGLKGSKVRGLSSYMILEAQPRSRAGHKREIFEVWKHLMATNQWTSTTVGEYWRYGRIFVKTEKSFLRAEIWHDTRPWSFRTRLARFSDIVPEQFGIS